MQRREFLKLAGAGLGSTLLLSGLSGQLAVLPVQAKSQGKLFRGYRNDGDILVSEDAGEPWQFHNRLGSQFSIDDLFVDASDQMYARVGLCNITSSYFFLKMGSNGKRPNDWL